LQEAFSKAIILYLFAVKPENQKSRLVSPLLYKQAPKCYSETNKQVRDYGGSGMRYKYKKKKTAQHKRLITVLIIFFTVVLLDSAGVLIYQMVILPVQSDHTVNEARAIYRKDNAASSAAATSEKNTSLAELQKINPDVQGWITIPNTVIDYPVLCPPKNDEDYYLTHDWKKQSSKYGSIYTLNEKTAPGTNKILFGHSMRDGRMFAAVLKYADLNFYRSAPVFTYQEGTEVSKWKVFAVIKTNTKASQGEVFDYLKTTFATSDDFLEFLYEVRLRSMLTLPVNISPSDEILTLSTCSYEFDGFRTAVFARKVRAGESDSVDTAAASVNNSALYPDCWYRKYGGTKPTFPSFAEARKQGTISWLIS
jgi:sortase B